MRKQSSLWLAILRQQVGQEAYCLRWIAHFPNLLQLSLQLAAFEGRRRSVHDENLVGREF